MANFDELQLSADWVQGAVSGTGTTTAFGLNGITIVVGEDAGGDASGYRGDPGPHAVRNRRATLQLDPANDGWPNARREFVLRDAGGRRLLLVMGRATGSPFIELVGERANGSYAFGVIHESVDLPALTHVQWGHCAADGLPDAPDYETCCVRYSTDGGTTYSGWAFSTGAGDDGFDWDAMAADVGAVRRAGAGAETVRFPALNPGAVVPPVEATLGAWSPASQPEGTGAGTTAYANRVFLEDPAVEEITGTQVISGHGANPLPASGIAGGAYPEFDWTIAVGNTQSNLMTVEVVRDAAAEADQQFKGTAAVTGGNATLAVAERVATVVNDDSGPNPDPETATLTATPRTQAGAAVSGRTVRYRSLNPSVATVGALTGVVTPVAPGKATIEARVYRKDGRVRKRSCRVTVTA